MRTIAIAFLFALISGCAAPTGEVQRSVIDEPRVTSYHGGVDETGAFEVDIEGDAPIVQVWCTDLAGVRRHATFTMIDGVVSARCEPGGEFEISVVH